MWGHAQVEFVAEFGEGIGSDLPATCGREYQRVGTAVAVGACLVNRVWQDSRRAESALVGSEPETVHRQETLAGLV